MFRLPFSNEPTDLDREIDACHKRMRKIGFDDPDYPDMINYLERLNKLKHDKRAKQVSRDTMLIVAGNIVGILIIVAYEQRHVMTSKGLDFIQKTKT